MLAVTFCCHQIAFFHLRAKYLKCLDSSEYKSKITKALLTNIMVNNLNRRGTCLNIRAFLSLNQWPEDNADFQTFNYMTWITLYIYTKIVKCSSKVKHKQWVIIKYNLLNLLTCYPLAFFFSYSFIPPKQRHGGSDTACA